MTREYNGPLCRCGCGERLPTDSTREFKRGHAKRFNDALADAFIEQNNPGFDPTVGVNLAPPDTSPLNESPENFASSFDQLAMQIPDDPDAEHPESEKIKTPISEIPVKVQKDIQGKLMFLFGFGTSLLMSLDPICVPVFQNQLPEITQKMVPIICQSPDMVKFFTKAGGFMVWLELATALWPVLQTVIAHHLTKSIAVGVDDKGRQVIVERDMSQYRV